MIRALALVACLVPAAAFAQSNFEPPADMRAAHDMMHGQHMMPGQAMIRHVMQGQRMDRQPPRDASLDKARSPRFRRLSKFS